MTKFIFYLSLLFFFTQTTYAADVNVTVSEVTDNRTTGKFFKGLDIEFEVKSQSLTKAKGMLPFSISKATSDLGENLVNKSKNESASFFTFQQLKPNKPIKIKTKLKNPSRKASSVHITGSLNIYVPDNNPNNIVTIKDYFKFSSKTIHHKNFKSRGISFTFFNKDDLAIYTEKAKKAKELARKKKINEKFTLIEEVGEDLADAFANMFWGNSDLTFIITDPNNQILKITLYNENGQEMETTSRSSSPKRISGRHGMNYKKMIPFKGKLVINLAGKNNIKTVPVNITAPLP